MDDSLKSRVQVFDPLQNYAVVNRQLPHWSQAGTISFITWRTADSIPQSVLKAWLAERDAWLKQHGINPADANWKNRLQQLGREVFQEFQLRITNQWNDHLDACHGACVLRRPDLAKEVADSLRHFDGDRYDLTDFIVMPNHVHVLVAFPDEDSMLKQCESWKHFTATQINRILNEKKRFWQQDGFDHLVRSVEQFQYLRRYIAENPIRAKLKPGEYIHESKPL